jgi:signal transduction histidine kinase
MPAGDPGRDDPAQGFDAVLQALDDEREDTANVLHDGPQQLMTAMRLVADGTLHALDDGDSERVRMGIERLEQLAEHGAAGLRRISIGLNPVRRDLADALAVLVELLEDRGVDASLAVEGDWPADGARDAAFYAVARECSLEAARRGAASISLSLAATADRPQLRITAGGGEIGESVLLLAGHRASAVGAQLEVGHGEQVVVELTARPA